MGRAILLPKPPSFGLRSAPFLFNQLSEVIEWILKSKCAISYVTHFLDDFLIMEPSSDTGIKSSGCEASLRSMLITFRNLGVPIAQGKTQGPSTKLEYLGITLDTDLMEASLPIDKVSRLRSELKSWHERKSATLVQLQSLIGSLIFNFIHFILKYLYRYKFHIFIHVFQTDLLKNNIK